MTVRDRLAAALREAHQDALWCQPPPYNHFADQLLALPGIAIVELPEPQPLTWPNSFTPHELSPAALRGFAAALLAAAAEVSND